MFSDVIRGELGHIATHFPSQEPWGGNGTTVLANLTGYISDVILLVLPEQFGDIPNDYTS